MLNILTILNYVKTNLNDVNGRFNIIDDEHIIDTKTGVEFHMYDDSFKLTYGDDTIATMNDMTTEEQSIVWSIKQLITSPEKARQRQAERPELIKQRRQKLSDLFEHPTPPHTLTAEPDATPYVG